MHSEDTYKTFLNVFDQDFYNQYYGCSSTPSRFWADNKLEGKYVNECIIKDNFDYGLFVSKLNWKNISIKTEYDAIAYFLSNINRYRKWFSTDQEYCSFKSNINLNKVCCIYVAYLSDEISLNIALNSIENIKSSIRDIKIITLGDIKYCEVIHQKYTNKIINIEDKYTLARYIKKYDYCLYLNNNNYIHSSLKDFVTQGMNSDADIFSTNDRYNITYNNKYYYGINSDIMLIKKNIVFKIFKCMVKNSNRISFYVNKLIQSNDIVGKCLIYNIKYKEEFWKNLFSFNILDYMYLIKDYKCPAISKKLYKVLRLNIRNCLLTSEISNTSGLSIIDKFINYKSKKPKNNIACHMHIGNNNSIYVNDIKKYTDIIQKLGIDLFVTSPEPIDNIDSYVLPNIGADIGPFLYVLNKHILNNNKYDYILKLHSKSHHGFRHMCFNSLINQLDYAIYLLDNQQNSAMAGLIDHNLPIDGINESKINEFCNRYGIGIKNNFDFFAGTMFIYKLNVIRSFIKKYKINLYNEYFNLEYGYAKNHQATKTHAWERILSGLIPHESVSDKIYI